MANGWPASWNYEADPATTDPRPGNRLRVVWPEGNDQVARLCNLIACETTSDADGRFELALPALPIAGLHLWIPSPGGDGALFLVPWTGASIDGFDRVVR